MFRVYAIGRRRADTGVGWLYSLAYRVHRENLEYEKIMEELRELIRYYEEDRDFERDLKVENFYSRVANRDIKYLLFACERFLREQSREPLDIRLEDILSDKFEIEHIWASDPSKLDLSEDLLEIHEQYKGKLGNLTIASKSWNSKWGKEQIEERESGIIKFALRKWKI